jgi:histidinol dehydrogenase
MNFDELLIQTSDGDYEARMQRLRTEHSMSEFLKSRKELAETVRAIVNDVAQRGDAAVAEYTERFDKVKLTPEQFRVSADEMKAAHASLDEGLLASLKKAIANVWAYQSEIFIGTKNTSAGIRYTPLRRPAPPCRAR